VFFSLATFLRKLTAGANRLVRSVDLTYSDQQAPSDPVNPIYTMLTSIAQTGYGNNGATRTMPPPALTYSVPVISPAVLTLDADSQSNLPEGLDGSRNRWIDLDGEGLPGVLTDAGSGWYFKRNRSANNLETPARRERGDAGAIWAGGDSSRTTITAAQGAAQTYTYVYDRYGNRWQQNLAQSGNGPQPQFTFNAANNQISTSGFAYDAAGNMTNDGSHTYTYDAEGNILQVDLGNTATYTYDAMNRRIRVVQGSANTVYLFNASGQRVSTWNANTGAQVQGQFYWGSQPVAHYTASPSQTHFQHQDWLGTERARTTYNGAVEGQFTSLPFGDGFAVVSGTDSDPYHFAGLDTDYEDTTQHAQFRNYSPAQGRWLAPDPYDGSYDASNPQSFNRYAYVLNNPLSYTDPSGKQCVVVSGGTYSVSTGGTTTTGSDPIVEACTSNGTEVGDWYCVQYGNCITYVTITPYVPTQASGKPPTPPVVAPNKGPRSGYESLFCLGDAIQSNGLSLALDAVGLLPEGGAVAGAFSLWHGAAGVSNGIKNLQTVKFGAGIISTASSGSGGDLFGSATGVASIAASLGKAAPIYGQVLSVVSLAGDAYKTLQDQSACVDSGKYD
jgi:RHS repeat-associated protein